jgi:hypothetical protein
MQFSVRDRLILLWLLIGMVAVGVCCLGLPAAHIGPQYVPVGNDSLYHARRILDAAADPSSFYQFDPKIHAPEGSIIVWPWGYDYALAWIVRLGVEAGITQQPMKLLAWIPTFAVLISVALMMLLARRLSLSVWTTALAGLSVAVSPLTPVLHAVGVIDHHWAEYIFVLASLGVGLKWFLNPEKVGSAAALGVLLGAAPSIHNGLFILQIPVLGLMFLWWLQDMRIPRRPVLFFGGSLLAATLAVLIPSLPFRMGLFEFYTLSWFHLYIAAGTAIAAILMSLLRRTWRSGAVLAVLGAVLLAPIGHQMLIAQGFLMGTLKRLDAIAEMASVPALARRDGGFMYVSCMYTLFLWLWPLTIGICAWKGWRERTTGRLFFWISALCGLVMLTLQFRMHYFGSFALILPWLVVLEDAVHKWEARRKLVMLLASLAFVLMYSLPLRYSLPSSPVAAGDTLFGPFIKIVRELAKQCEKNPGIVLADNDAGHVIRYFTKCSVIANNFLLTKQQLDKIELFDHLMELHADEMPQAAPYVRYVFMRPVSILPMENGAGVTYMSYSQAPKTTLMSDLLLTPVKDVSPRYKLLSDVVMETDDPQKPLPFMRLYEVEPAPKSAVPAMAQSDKPDNSRQ